MSEGSRLERALRALADALDARADRHPSTHLLKGRGASIELRLGLPLRAGPADLERIARDLDAGMASGLDRLARERAVIRPGAVFCLRCDGAGCEHARPDDPRAVFAGYSPTGLPRFTDLGAALQEAADPRVEGLYGDFPKLVAKVWSEEQLVSELLPAFRDKISSFRLHGQVGVGWFRHRNGDGRPEPFAVTLQVVSLERSRTRRRFGVNVIGCGPRREGLGDLGPRMTPPPWSSAVSWAETVTSQLERAWRGPRDDERVGRRISGLLDGLSRRVSRRERSANRRTRHADERHTSGDRPTRMAVSDLARAGDERIFFDPRAKTLVVLGERGRTHVFGADGRLVTSIRYPPGSIDAKLAREAWRSATADEIAALKSRLVRS